MRHSTIMRKIYDRILELCFTFFLRRRLKNRTVQRRFQHLSERYTDIFSLFNATAELERGSEGYSWDTWSGKIRKTFKDRVDLGFLSQPLLRFTMVFGGRGAAVQETSARIDKCIEIFGEQISRQLLIEDYVGLPIISNAKFLTSANCAHHTSHLAHYTKLTEQNVWDSNSVIEWGGGYGSMARIVRRMNPDITYIIVDLPELLALQYIYLGSLEGTKCVHIIQSRDDTVIPGKINLVSSDLILSDRLQIDCELFITTWALTECPKYMQEFVVNKKFFGAQSIFIASLIDTNNILNDKLKQGSLIRIPVPYLQGQHEYWVFKENCQNKLLEET